MTDPTPAPDPAPDGATPDGTKPTGEPPATPTPDDVARLQAALDKERGLRKDRERELGQFKTQAQASMTEAERAAAEAEERGYGRARVEYGERLARTEYIAEAARRNSAFDVAAVLDDINLARFIREDGEPDSKAIAASVARLVPETAGTPAPPSFDGGPRTTATPSADMNRLIREAFGRA